MQGWGFVLSVKRNFSTRRAPKKGGMAQRVIDRPPSFVGWRSSDEEEIARRLWRGRTEVLAVEALELAIPSSAPIGCAPRAVPVYEVEIRSLAARENSCGCVDHAVNGLGTCKHIEGALHALRRGRSRQFDQAARRGCPWAEVYVRRQGEPEARLQWPGGPRLWRPDCASTWAVGSRDEGVLRGTPREALSARAATGLPGKLRRQFRVSRHLDAWADGHRRREARAASASAFWPMSRRRRQSRHAAAIRSCPISVTACCISPSPNARCSPTTWASARPSRLSPPASCCACSEASTRVLVVCPASLKAEWEEQIARFTDSSRASSGLGRAARALYHEPAFFTIVNYEQVHDDARRYQSSSAARRGHSRRGAAHQELADQDRAGGQGAAVALRLRADRHAAREPHRRALLDRPVSGP